jgi:hypothetical protein
MHSCLLLVTSPVCVVTSSIRTWITACECHDRKMPDRQAIAKQQVPN